MGPGIGCYQLFHTNALGVALLPVRMNCGQKTEPREHSKPVPTKQTLFLLPEDHVCPASPRREGRGAREGGCTDLPSQTSPRAVQRRSHLWTFETTAQQIPRRPIITGEKGSTCPWRLETCEVTLNPRSEKTNQNRQRIGTDKFKTRFISSNYTSLSFAWARSCFQAGQISKGHTLLREQLHSMAHSSCLSFRARPRDACSTIGHRAGHGLVTTQTQALPLRRLWFSRGQSLNK